MTAIGVIILITQILPSVGYYPKEDEQYVNSFKPAAEEIILDNILKDEAGEGLLVLENFKETIRRASDITPDDITKESQTLAGIAASGVLGTLNVLPKAIQKINVLEQLLLFMVLNVLPLPFQAH